MKGNNDMKKKMRTPEEKERIVKRFLNDESTIKLAKEVETDRSKIYVWVKKYETKAKQLVSKVEETLNTNDYINAVSYLTNIKDEKLKKELTEKLNNIKEKIDGTGKPAPVEDDNNIQTGQLMTNFFKETGHLNDLKIYKNVSHGSVAKKALTEDDDNDKISDLIYWALSQSK